MYSANLNFIHINVTLIFYCLSWQANIISKIMTSILYVILIKFYPFCRIHRLDVHDSEKTRRETALNNLESYVIDAQQKFDSEEFSNAATDKEIEEIRKACAETSEWLYEDGFAATAEVYEEKLMELQKLTNDVYERVFEYRNRPEVLNGMVSLLQGSRLFLENMRNLSLTSEVITPIEIETLEKVINEIQVRI